MKTIQKHSSKDWHPADIKAAMAKKGYTFARIAREHGYVSNAPNSVLRKPWTQVQAIVAGIIGEPASVIWPSRYDASGEPICARPARLKTKV